MIKTGYTIWNKNRVLLNILAILFIFSSCTNKENKPTEHIKSKEVVTSGIKTEPVQISDYKKTIYVDADAGDGGNGEKQTPLKLIANALDRAKTHTNSGRVAIMVAEGEYLESNIQMVNKVDLFGGFNQRWERNVELYKTTIDADGKSRVLIGANDARIDGFIISGGRVNGKGAGIYCSGTSPTITNNLFTRNTTLAPDNWNPEFWHETANDGGAIYFENGSNTTVRNCAFIDNKTENGRGAALAANNKCVLKISDNVFIGNIAGGAKDTMRSSDGGAISIFDWCTADITNNIFLSNKALNHNDGGAVFVALWSSANVNGNIFVNSYADDDAGALFVGGQEHRYGGASLDPIPATKDFSVHISNNLFLGNKNSSMNSGVMRFTMESKGSYTNNISALNNGIYFQRSEIAVKENIILDNFLFIETKKGLLPGEITNNLIWADFILEVIPSVSGNKIKGRLNTLGKQHKAPKFVNDGLSSSVISLNVDKKMNQTEILVIGKHLKPNSLVNRVIRSGDKWGVVQSNSETYITVWGNLYGAETIQLLPTYTVLK